jgi:hypothetical protein
MADGHLGSVPIRRLRGVQKGEFIAKSDRFSRFILVGAVITGAIFGGASVGSTEASASLLARVGVVGPKRATRLAIRRPG